MLAIEYRFPCLLEILGPLSCSVAISEPNFYLRGPGILSWYERLLHKLRIESLVDRASLAVSADITDTRFTAGAVSVSV